METKIIAYKAFDKDFKCRDFQYEVGKEYEMDGDIKCCERGFHACESPLEVLDHYDMFNSSFAEVEQTGEIVTDGKSTQVCSSKIKIKAELKLEDIINLGIKWLQDNSCYYNEKNSSNNSIKVGSSSNHVNITSVNNRSQIGTSGVYVGIHSSGEYVKIASTGNRSNISSSGICAKITSTGKCTIINSSGDCANILSTGDYDKISSSGYRAIISSSGNHSVIMANGYYSIAKANIGSWITLTEYVRENDILTPICVKTEQVDGERIKANTFYELIDGNFQEVDL